MSFNIDYTLVLENDNLRVKFDDLKEIFKKAERQLEIENSNILVGLGEDEIEIRIEGEYVYFDSMMIMGMGSGHAFSDIILPMIHKSKGKLVLYVSWEYGQEADIVIAEDGKFHLRTFQPIEVASILYEKVQKEIRG